MFQKPQLQQQAAWLCRASNLKQQSFDSTEQFQADALHPVATLRIVETKTVPAPLSAARAVTTVRQPPLLQIQAVLFTSQGKRSVSFQSSSIQSICSLHVNPLKVVCVIYLTTSHFCATLIRSLPCSKTQHYGSIKLSQI